jgi:hypothetical protein
MPRHWITAALQALSHKLHRPTRIQDEFDAPFKSSILEPYYIIKSRSLPLHLSGALPPPPSAPQTSATCLKAWFHIFSVSFVEARALIKNPDQPKFLLWIAMMRLMIFCNGAVCLALVRVVPWPW